MGHELMELCWERRGAAERMGDAILETAGRVVSMEGHANIPELKPVRGVGLWRRGTILIPGRTSSSTWPGRPTPSSFAWGMVLALLGEAIRIWGVGYTGVTTRNDHVIALRLTTAGTVCAHVRNPLYVGNCMTAFGFFMIACGGLGPLARAILSPVAGDVLRDGVRLDRAA